MFRPLPKGMLRLATGVFSLLATTLLFSAANSQTIAADPGGAPPAAITLLTAAPHKVVFEVIPPALDQQRVILPSGSYQKLAMAGYGTTGEPGRPALPQRAIYLALPPGAEPVVTLLDSDRQTLTGVSILPAVQTTLVEYEAGDPAAVPTFRDDYPVDEATYDSEALYPAAPVSLGEISWLRDQRVVKVWLRPAQANPARRTLTVHTRLLVEVTFQTPLENPAGLSSRPAGSDTNARPESPAFERVLSQTILNYEQGREWRRPRPAGSQPQPSPCLDDNAFRLTLDETGMYVLTQADLRAAWPSFPTSVEADSLRMCRQGDEIAIQVSDGDSDGNFESGDAITFYGEAIKTQETTTHVYWLTYGGSADGLRMDDEESSNSGPMDTSYGPLFHLEEDLEYYSQFPTEDLNDHWYAAQIAYGVSGLPTTYSASFTLANQASAAYSAPVTVEVSAFLAVEDHTFEVRLNNTSLGTASFTASGHEAPFAATFTAPSTAFQEGANTLSIIALDSGNGGTHTMLVNWLEIIPQRQYVAQDDRLAFTQPDSGPWKYTVTSFSNGNNVSVYDVRDPLNPVEITGLTAVGGSVTFGIEEDEPAAYEMTTAAARLQPLTLVKDTASDLADPTNQADYLIITDPSLDSALTPLRGRRASQGLVVKTVYIQDIFDEFSSGLYATEAIRNFLDYAYTSWQAPAPSYVLLAGEGSFDHRNVEGNNGAGDNLVPVYLKSGVDSNLGEAAADNQYVAFGPDNVAQMMLGRLPAANTSELTAIVDKIIAYETAALAPAWQSTHLFVADNTLRPPAPCEPDPAGDFFGVVNAFIANFFPDSQLLRRLYYAPFACYPNEDDPNDYSYYAGESAVVFGRIIEEMNAGVSFINYTGHSAIANWGHESFLTTTNIGALANGGRTPIMLPMTCLEGIYHFPETPGLSESLLRLEDAGAVASYAPTGLQVQKGHDYLLEGFYTAVFDDGALTLGEAVMGAKENLATSSPLNYQDLQDTFMLLGDPAMPFNLWQSTTQLKLPVIKNQ
ncbi:MAG: C25 family cysteine peptidase [Chloroflexota bacterium]